MPKKKIINRRINIVNVNLQTRVEANKASTLHTPFWSCQYVNHHLHSVYIEIKHPARGSTLTYIKLSRSERKILSRSTNRKQLTIGFVEDRNERESRLRESRCFVHTQTCTHKYIAVREGGGSGKGIPLQR